MAEQGKAKVIYVTGPMGSGKTVIATALVDAFRTSGFTARLFDDCRPSQISLPLNLKKYDYLVITGYTNSMTPYLAEHLYQTLKLSRKG